MLFIRRYGKKTLNTIAFLVAMIINNFPKKIYASVV